MGPNGLAGSTGAGPGGGMHRRLRPAAIRGAILAALAREDVPPQVRAIEADLMTEAELHGVPSHGLLMLPRLIRGFREGRATPDPCVRVMREAGATCVLDGDRTILCGLASAAPGATVASARRRRALKPKPLEQ